MNVMLGVDNLGDARWARPYQIESSPRALEENVKHCFQLKVGYPAEAIYENVMHTANLVRSAFGIPHLSKEDFAQVLAGSV
jgi:hypothetical protein